MADLSATIVLLGKNLAGGAINEARGQLDELGTTANRAGGMLSGIGAGIELAAGIMAFEALSTAITDVVSSAIDWQNELVLLRNNTTFTKDQTTEAGVEILKLSDTYGIATDTIVTAYRHVMDITQDAATAQVVMNEAVKASAATGADASTIGNVLAGVMHEYGTDVVRAADGTNDLTAVQTNATKTMGIMVAAAQDSNSTVEAWTNNLSQAIGIAAAGNQPLEQVGAAFASLTLHGFPDNAKAGVQVKDLFVQLAHLSAGATAELERLGKASGVDVVGDLAQMNEGTMTLSDFLGHLREAYIAVGLSQADFRIESEKLINGQRGGLGLNALLTTGYYDMTRVLADLSNQTRVNTVVDEAWQRSQQTVKVQWDILTNTVNNFAKTLGAPLLGVIEPIIERFNNNLPNAFDKVHVALDFVGGAAEVVGHDFGILWAATEPLRDIMTTVADHWLAAMGGLGNAVGKLFQGDIPGALSTATAALTSWYTWIAGEFARLTVLFGNWVVDSLPGLMTNLGIWIGQLLGWIGSNAQYIADHMQAWTDSFVLWVDNSVAPLMQKVGDLLGRLGDWISGTGVPYIESHFFGWVEAFWKWIQEVDGPLLSAAGTLLGQLGDWILNTALPFLLDQVKSWGQAFVDWIGPQIDPMMSQLGDLLGRVGDWITGTGYPLLKDNVSHWTVAFIEWIIPLTPQIIGELFSLLGTVTNWLVNTALTAIVESLASWTVAFVKWVGPASVSLIGELFSIQGSVIHWILDQVPAIAYALGSWAGAFYKWVDDAATRLFNEVPKILDSVNKWVNGDGLTGMLKAGGDLAGGFLKGFEDFFLKGIPDLVRQIGNLVQEAIKAMQAGLAGAAQAGNSAIAGFNSGAAGGATPSTFRVSTGGVETQSQAIANPASLAAVSSTLNADPTAVAKALCGPEAYALLSAALGRPVTIEESLKFAATYGWNVTGGMNGFGNFVNMLKGGGIPFVTTDITTAQNALAAGGSTAVISTSNPNTGGHYFVASGYDPTTGKMNVGDTGTVVGGSQQMSLADIQANKFGGDVNGIALVQTPNIAPGMTGAGSSTAGESFDPSAAMGNISATEKMIRMAAVASNIDPDVAVRVWQGEGAVVGAGTGDQGSSFGPFQLHVGGIAPGMNAGPGAGNDFQNQTGLDLRDPKNAEAATRWYLAQVSSTDTWKQSHGAANVGVGLTEGIGPPGTTWTGGPGEPVAGTPAGADYLAGAAKAAGTGETGLDQLAKYTQTTQDFLAKSVSDTQTKLTAVDTTLTGKIGVPGVAIGSIQEGRDQTAADTARKQALTYQLADDKTANDIRLANENLVNARALQDADVVNKRTLEDTATQTANKLAAENTVHQRGLQDTEIAYQNNLAKEATAHARTLEDQKIVADQILQDQATAHSRKLQDQQIAANQVLADAARQHALVLQNQQTEINQAAAAAQTAHQRALQDAQIQPNVQLASTATGHSRTLEDQQAAYDNQQKQIRDAAALQVDLAAATTDAQKQQIQTTFNAQVQATNLAAQYAAQDTAHKRQVEDQEAIYQQGLQAAAIAKQRQLEDAETQYQKGVADSATLAANGRAKTEADYQAGLAATALQTQRTNEDTEATYQRGLAQTALDLSRKNADIETGYQQNLAAGALQHRRDLEDAATAYAIDQTAKLTAAKRVLEDAALARTRALEDDAIARKINQDKAASDYARAQKQQQDDLDKKLADEAYARQVALLTAEANLQKQGIIAAADEARQTRQKAFDEEAASIISKSKAAVEKAGGDFGPIEDQMNATVAAMDQNFATAHEDSGQALIELTQEAADALSKKIPASIADTANAMVNTFGAGGTVPDAIGVTDQVVEAFANATGKNWDDSRVDLNALVNSYGIGSQQISSALGITDQAVERFASEHHTDWNTARADLNAAALNMGQVLGNGGTIPVAAGQTSTAIGGIPTAINLAKTPLQQLQEAATLLTKQGLDPATQAAKDLNTAIQNIQNKTISVTTNFLTNNSGTGAPITQAAGNASYANSIAALGRDTGSTNFNPVGSSGNNASTDTHASPFGASTIGSSGPGGKFNDPSTGQPYTHATGGVTTGPIFGWDGDGNKHVAGEAGREAIIPLDQFFAAHAPSNTGPTVIRLHPDDITAIVQGLAKIIPTTIGMSSFQSAAIQLKRRGGSF